MSSYHIDVLSVSITDSQLSREFTEAIEAKVTAQQRSLEAKDKLER